LAIGLSVESCGHALLDPGQLEKLAPEISCECQVTVADNGVGDAIQMDDVDEERLSHRGR
jgi:hypothetical protein